ncbi:MAG TPA: DUF748 domain-containing protein [Tepidisphaeraceae bacterium]
MLRILVNIMLPTVLRKVAAAYDLNCSYGRSQMNLLSGDAELWYLNFVPKSGGEPVLKLDYVRGNISTLALLRGQLDAWRVEADGVEALIERTADGRVPLLETIQAKAEARAKQASAPPPTTQPRDVDLTPPMRIDALRFTHVKTRIVDRSVTPTFDSTLMTSVRVSDVQSPVRPTTFAIELWNDPVLDLLRIEGQGKASGKNLDADVNVIVRGFRPIDLQAYLEPLGIRPVTRALALQGKGKLHLQPATAPSQAVAGDLVLHDMYVWNEGAEAATVQRVEVKADSIDFDAAKIASLLIDGVKVNLSAAADNRAVGFAGLELVPTNKPKAAPATRPASSHYAVSLAQVSVRNVHATFQDQAFNPPNQLSFVVDDLTAQNILSGPGQASKPVDITGHMSAPGISKAIELSAQVEPFADKKTLKLSINANGINPEALKPYLDAAGFESELHAGVFTAEVNGDVTTQPDGRISADGQLTKLRFTDGSAELLAMSDVKLRGAGFDPKSGLVRVDSIDISGPGFYARRDAGGQISVLGLRTKPPTPHANVPTTAPTTAVAASRTTSTIQLPRLQIGRFSWKDLKLTFDDEQIVPKTTITVADAGVELDDLLIDPTGKTDQAKEGKLKAWLSAPGIVENGSIEGTLTPQLGGFTTDLQIAAKGVTANALKPYLAPLGVEPLLRDGQVAAHAKVNLAQIDNGIGASVALDNVKYLDGDQELAGVDSLQLNDVKLMPDGLSVEKVQIDKPRGSVTRDGQGLFSAGGIKLLSTTRPAAVATAPPTTQTVAQASQPFVATVKQFVLNDASLKWSDQLVSGGVNTSANVSAQVDGLTVGRQADPAPFKLHLTVPGSVQQLDVAGKLTTAPDTQGIDMEVTGQGLAAGPLAAYVPPGQQVSLQDGRLHALVTATVSKHPEGGEAAKVLVRDVKFSDGPDGAALLKLDSFTANASRVDPEKVIAIDEISLNGLEADVHQAADGSTRAFGITMGPAPTSQQPAATTAPVAVVPTTGPSATEGKDVATLVAAARKPPPLVTVEKLDLNVTRLSLHNDAQPEAAPVTLANLNVKNVGRIEVGGPEAQSRPPAEVQVSGKIEPLVDSFNLDTKVVPFAQQPSANITLSASGIQGDGLTKLVPSLKQHLDGAAMTDGRFQTKVELLGKFARRGPVEYDLTKPFDVELTVSGTEFRSSPDSPVLAGLEGMHAEAVHVEPETGAVRIKTLELTKPIGNAWRDKDGLHVAGLTIKLPESGKSTTEPATPTEQAQLASASSAPPTTTPASAKPSAEMRIDRLIISGLDFHIEDRAVDPPMVVPLNGLDVEVRDLSNMALYENRPIQFSAVVTSGKAPLPSVKPNAGTGDIDERELFSQIAATGKLSLYPETSGWAKTSVNGFEMVSLRGLAHEEQITLGKGVFDGNFDLRFPGDGSIDTKSKLVITDLQITEPPGGTLQKTLALPGPLDAVIKALQDPDESITVPLNVAIKQGQLSGVGGAAVGAFSSIVVTAMASAPVKMLGLGNSGKPAGEEQPVALPFDPGVTVLNDSERQTLDQLITRMQKDKNVQVTLRHELGGGDVGRAETRANPDPQECLNLAYRLRSRKMELLAERAQLAGQVRGMIASSPASNASQQVARLRALDTEIAQTDDALDKVYDMLRPGAQRQAARRTRSASLELAQDRLDLVKAYLLASRVPDATTRVAAVNPTFTAPETPDGGGKVLVTVIAKKKQ